MLDDYQDSRRWDNEYERRGIPSSRRSEPSGVLLWALDNFGRVTSHAFPKKALDLGCGTGRNSLDLAKKGIDTVGVDYSQNAISLARKRLEEEDPAATATFRRHNIRHALPFASGEFDFATDTFVYFHVLPEDDRRSYRAEIARVLGRRGILLLSLATKNDGYYASCPSIDNWRASSSIELKLDPEAGVGNILPSQDELLEEMSDIFLLRMFWIKRVDGKMHGKTYARETIGTLWSPK
ncbi:class I SAM-dependent methyltransferase [Pseudofrankia sp. BMG5.36]|uniref:class I SAM-dependent methyltransferase n=1 Tax=Pseudofrankia sp. BMG5.36 TaxID=1834512 RepID=UPI0009F181BA|nr:class I SAM-dependent methyltransferase [Pseudofrankia sp. BMG5.36]